MFFNAIPTSIVFYKNNQVEDFLFSDTPMCKFTEKYWQWLLKSVKLWVSFVF